MTHSDVELRILDSPEEAAEAAAELLAEAARAGARLALSGGTTPRPAYERAARLEPDWSHAELYWADERCVPPDDERSNFRLVRESILDRVAQQPAAVHRVRGELDPEEAAAEYDEALQGVTLDLVLLGIGPDGHTASLFPDSAALRESDRRAVAVADPDVPRVTLTPPPLEAASTVLFLVTGVDKADAVRRAFAEEPRPSTPASMIRSAAGSTVAILDAPAAEALGF